MSWTEKRGVGTLSGMIETLIVIGLALLVWIATLLERISWSLKAIKAEIVKEDDDITEEALAED